MDGLESFKRHLSRNGKRQSTIEKHLKVLAYVFSCCQSFTAPELERLLFQMYEQGRSPGYLNIIVQVVRNYAKFIEDEELQKIGYYKVQETVKGVLSDEEITKLLAITPEQYNDWLRNTLRRGGGHVDVNNWNKFTTFFTILAFSGLRPKELATMRLQQCDLGSKLFRLDATTKTSKPRTVSINDMLIPVLEKHLSRIADDNLFPNWSRHKWKEQFNMRIKYLGIRRDKISTYSLRHSWVTRLLDEQVNPHVLAEMAGHSLEQQSHYYNLTSKSKRVAIQKDPLGRKSLTLNERMLQGRKALEDLGFIVSTVKQITTGFYYEVMDES